MKRIIFALAKFFLLAKVAQLVKWASIVRRFWLWISPHHFIFKPFRFFSVLPNLTSAETPHSGTLLQRQRNTPDQNRYLRQLSGRRRRRPGTKSLTLMRAGTWHKVTRSLRERIKLDTKCHAGGARATGKNDYAILPRCGVFFYVNLELLFGSQ